MDITSDHSERFSRMEIVDSGRRRRFTDEAKLAIVAESYAGPRLVTLTAQRHGITRWQLNAWRRAAREGRLVHRSAKDFIPAVVVAAEPVFASTPAAETVAVPSPTTDRGRMEVVSANGRRVIVGQDVDVNVLLRIMRGLETLR